MEGIKKILSLALNNKGKFVLMLFSTLVFGFLLFPFGDLGDLVSSQVSKMTNNQIFVQFDQLHMSLTGVALDNINVEARGFPPLRADQIVFTPSIMSLINQKPAGSIDATGFLKGNLEASFSPTSKSESGIPRHKMTLSAKKLSLSELREIAQLPVRLMGNLSAEAIATMDLTFQEQPDIEIQMNVDRFEMPISTVQTMMGPVALPDLKLANVELKGRLSAGKMLIEKGIIGKDTDELHGTVKGEVGMILRNMGGNIVPEMGAYNLEVNLDIRKSFQAKAALFLGLVNDSFKTPIADGSHYAFRLTGNGPTSPPSMSALR